MNKQLLLYIIFLFFSCECLLGQVRTVRDDSTKVYSNIEKYSQKRRFTKFIHKLIFRPTQKITPQKKKKQGIQTGPTFAKYQGKVIRNITIVPLDPFGFTVDNPDKKPTKWIEKAGNATHIKTQKWTIRNNLLFKKNERLDSLRIKESERLIQRYRYIRNVRISPIPINNSKDSVDIVITSLDSWSIVPTGAISSSSGNLELTERNFLGLGHFFENNFKNRFSDNENAYGMRYIIPNFKNSFISTGFYYDKDFSDNYVKGISIDRSFFSPYTRWAGGVGFEQRFYRDSIKDAYNVSALKNFKLETLDTWGGHSFQIFKKSSSADEITNLVTTLRFRNTKYLESPGILYDSILYFNNSKLHLATIGLSSRRFVENRFLFNNGIPEYVQIGKTYSFTSGFDEKNSRRRTYFGGRFSFGGFYRFGYFATNFEIGSFFRGGVSEQTALRLEGVYFTDLIEVGRWKIRQFVNPQLTIGNNRIANNYDRLTLSGSNGIQGFNSGMFGTKKFLVSFQTQTYVPGSLLGFRASPFLNYSLGILGDQSKNLMSNKAFSKIGIGVLISNDYLVFNSFQLSFAYYPSIPEEGQNIYKFNSFKNNDIDLQDFQIGRPSIVPYQ